MEENFNILKPRVMLHIIMPKQVGGPNIAAKLIGNSFLSENFTFGYLIQEKHSGRKISFSLIKDFIKQINNFEPDIIHLSGLQGSGFHAVIAARLCGKRNILLTVRGSATDAINISSFMRIVFGKFVEPITMRLSNKIYTVCEAMAKRDYIIRNSKNRLIGTIHNSIPSITAASIERFDLKNKLGVEHESILVAIVGRIIYDKGVTFVAEAIQKINNKNIKFIFIGDEPGNMNFSHQLAHEINEKRVFLMGIQNNVISILNECDIFLFATLHENLSNALLEACSVGLAVIATQVGGNPEVIKDKYNGLLIPPANTEKIIEAVLYLSNNEDKRLELGHNAKKYVNENFSQEKLLKKLEQVYIEMLNS